MSMSRWVSPRERRAALPEEPLARVQKLVMGKPPHQNKKPDNDAVIGLKQAGAAVSSRC